MGLSKRSYMDQVGREERMQIYCGQMYALLKAAVKNRDFYSDKSLAVVKALLKEIDGD